ncbi:putative transcriptional regulator, TetR family [Nocardioidaceae bacterium Broad-1]|uniref:TetR/AcrR family transcriptional regulator n=1 Tax=Nocardioides luteus TaxID=1844 RepID=UPI000202895B|nr:TetR family transcriptional regulator C-terminal domain-containing protein [Nocardioides luteus]EGD45158.1 putative transcriptional regulator, TetR family [Nocardioidaceae bacterium Broad-1]MBG6099404.1 AcrR family transcriptional regulator [Nocardioides luteus]
MPKIVDHRERREAIAHALWRVVEQQGWPRATMREVAHEAGVSLGQLQHYFSSRASMLAFAMEFAAEQTSSRVANGLAGLGQHPHPRDVLRVVVTEMLPLHPDAHTTSRMNAAYVLEALHDPELREVARAGLREGRDLVERLIRQAIADGQIPSERDPAIETDLILALTGFTPLLELGVIEPGAALAAVDQHLDRLFSGS